MPSLMGLDLKLGEDFSDRSLIRVYKGLWQPLVAFKQV